MSQVIELLKQRYLDSLKKDSELFVGIELEYPIVNLSGQATDIGVSKKLLTYLAKNLPFRVEKYDDEYQPIQLFHPETGDCILFEVSYNLLEFAFGKVRKIQEVEKRFTTYLTLIQSFLAQYNHALQGEGIHPSWSLNDNQAVRTPRYRLLTDFLKLAPSYPERNFHHFTDYGGFICGSQVQLDVSPTNYLRVLNAFNQLEPVKAYLFANSPFSGADWQTRVARDIFWERSMHGYFPENVGLYTKSFDNSQAYLDYLSLSSLFYVLRKGELYYFPPIRVKDYFNQAVVIGYNSFGEKYCFKPDPADLNNHRTYHYQALTTRGTVEFRSACCQPINRTFLVAAFHLGLLVNLDKLEELLIKTDFYRIQSGSISDLRKKYASIHLSPKDFQFIQSFTQQVLTCAREGLLARGYGEEKFLTNLT